MGVVKAFLHNGMEYYETPALVSALCMMVVVLVSKVMATGRLSRLEKELQALEDVRNERLNSLRISENEKAVANANLSMLTNKKLGLIKRREALKKEIEEINKEVNKRQERAESRKVKM